MVIVDKTFHFNNIQAISKFQIFKIDFLKIYGIVDDIQKKLPDWTVQLSQLVYVICY